MQARMDKLHDKGSTRCFSALYICISPQERYRNASALKLNFDVMTQRSAKLGCRAELAGCREYHHCHPRAGWGMATRQLCMYLQVTSSCPAFLR